MLQEFIERRGMAEEHVVGVMLPTCPLRRVSDIRDAFRLFRDAGSVAPVCSVAPFERPIRLAQCLGDDGRLDPIFRDEYYRSTRSQDHAAAYWFNGAIVFNSAARFLRQSTLIGERPMAYVMPLDYSVDIDHEFQIDLVNVLLKQQPSGER